MIFDFLDKLEIGYIRRDHDAAMTCQELSSTIPDLEGLKTKNLFLRDKKGSRHFLVISPDHKKVDLLELSKELSSGGRLSMASKERLDKHLGILPGAVSLLALINDKSQAVEVLLDQEVWSAESVQCHPLVNTCTLVIRHHDLEKFLEATGHKAKIMALPSL